MSQKLFQTDNSAGETPNWEGEISGRGNLCAHKPFFKLPDPGFTNYYTFGNFDF